MSFGTELAQGLFVLYLSWDFSNEFYLTYCLFVLDRLVRKSFKILFGLFGTVGKALKFVVTPNRMTAKDP